MILRRKRYQIHLLEIYFFNPIVFLANQLYPRMKKLHNPETHESKNFPIQ